MLTEGPYGPEASTDFRDSTIKWINPNRNIAGVWLYTVIDWVNERNSEIVSISEADSLQSVFLTA